jgi:hypothetical protein
MSDDKISQVKFWIEGLPDDNNQGQMGEMGGIAQFLSYKVFLGLSVLGGFLALDHLYLRSPLTFLAKLVINLLCFGVWWLYDALQAVFNTDIVKIYGLGVPGLGPKGIGAGVLASDQASPNHWNFFIYSVVLLFGGLIGLDSFLVGDKRSGIIRLICTITVIFFPVALLWWGYNVVRYFFDTKGVVNQYSEYFGAPFRSPGYGIDLTSMMTGRLGPAIVQSVSAPITAAIGVVDQGVKTVDNMVQTVGKIANTAKQVTGAINQAGKVMSQGASVVPAADLIYSKTAKLSAPGSQKGGKKLIESFEVDEDSNLNLVGYTLLGTIAFISVTGFIATIYRSKDVSSTKQSREKDDSPPKPGVL